jgi:hypothetical protein
LTSLERLRSFLGSSWKAGCCRVIFTPKHLGRSSQQMYYILCAIGACWTSWNGMGIASWRCCYELCGSKAHLMQLWLWEEERVDQQWCVNMVLIRILIWISSKLCYKLKQ